MAVASGGEGAAGLLKRTKLSELCRPDQEVVLLEHNLSVGEALKKLAQHRILSAPMVVAPDLEDLGPMVESTSPSLLGWVSIDDVLRAFLGHLQSDGKPLPTKMLALMTVLEEAGPGFADKMLITLGSSEDRGLVYKADGESTSLMDAIQDIFLHPDANGSPHVVHRLAVFDAHGDITNVVSQMDVMKFVLAHLSELGNDQHRTIADLGMLNGKPPVLSVSPHIPALVAYDRMASQSISGAPVVTDNGEELIANLSVSDIRGLIPEHFGVLALPVAEFLAVQHNTEYLGYSITASTATAHPFFARSDIQQGTDEGPDSTDIRTITCAPTISLAGLLHKLCDAHVHRVYVVDGADNPHVQAVVTLTDVLRVIAGVF